MKKHSIITRRVLRLCLLLGALLTTSNAFAGYFNGTDEELILEKEYVLTNLASVNFRQYYYFTPEADGTLSIDCSWGLFTRYFDNTYDRDEKEMGDHAYGADDGGFTNDANGVSHKSEMTVTAGVTYYVAYSSSAANDATFTAHLYTSSDTPEITFLSPEEGDVLEINDDGAVYGNITMAFNRSVEMGTITLYAGDPDNPVYQRGMGRTNQNGLYVVNVREFLYLWLSEGYINKGDEVWITIEDVYAIGDPTCLYNGDGLIELHWKAPKCPVGLVSATWPEEFLSWWDEGDERALATLVFEDDLATYDGTPAQTAFVYVQFGDREAEDGFYQETLKTDKISVDGNVMTIDFSGKSRTRLDMTPDVDNSAIEIINFNVHYVKDADGDYCYSTISGGIGSYSGQAPYTDLSGGTGGGTEASTDVVVSPANGENIGRLSKVTVTCEAGLAMTWYSDPDESISYTEEDIIVYDADGEPVAHGVKDAYEEIGTTGYTFTLSDTLLAEGDYTLTIPEMFFYVGKGADTYSDAISNVVHIDPALDGITKIAVAGDNAAYYNLGGQKVSAPTKGVYITNGKKVVVK